MKLLLDTHSFLWFITNDSNLSTKAHDLISDPQNDVLVSPASNSTTRKGGRYPRNGLTRRANRRPLAIPISRGRSPRLFPETPA